MKEQQQEKSLDPQLWHACAGSMVQIPSVNSTIFYFPQGHSEHCHAPLHELNAPPRAAMIPSLILCRVLSVKFLADADTDEVFAKISLLPLPGNDPEMEAETDGEGGGGNADKPASFAKTLTQSDANNGGGFSVPRYCAETIFPRLDYTADPPVQTVIAKDIHGDTWKFRHIYRGTPRRHLLTTGWSTFVNQKKLVAGDSIVFLRSESGELCIGIRRAKRGGVGAGPEMPFSGFFRGGEDDNKFMMMRRSYNNNNTNNNNNNNCGDSNVRVRPEAVAEAVARAVNGQAFEVVYYPRASTPEFCVKAAAVRSALRIRWCSGMRFKMAFETEDSSRISWFMGTVSSVQVADPIRWPNSPWRLLQVAWDEPDLLQNVKRVNPWLVELVSNMPAIHLSPFSPRKKLRVLQPFDFPLDGTKFPMPPPFSGNNNPLCYLSDNNAPTGIQGARHAQLFGTSLLSDLHLSNSNKFQPGLFLSGFKQLDSQHSRVSDSTITRQSKSSENISCSLTMGNSNSSHKSEKSDIGKRCQFVLFGQPILTEQQVLTRKRSSEETNREETKDFSWNFGFQEGEAALDTGHCKVFVESEDVGRTLDLTVISSYEELYRKLANMFGIERLDSLTHVLYRDANGNVKRIGDEPYSEFMKSVKRLTIMMESQGSDNVRKTWITGMRKAENGLDATNKTGPLSIFA